MVLHKQTSPTLHLTSQQSSVAMTLISPRTKTANIVYMAKAAISWFEWKNSFDGKLYEITASFKIVIIIQQWW